jgi:hypothetical protein
MGHQYLPLRLFIIENNDLTNRVARCDNVSNFASARTKDISNFASARTPSLSLRAARIAAMKSESAKFHDSANIVRVS